MSIRKIYSINESITCKSSTIIVIVLNILSFKSETKMSGWLKLKIKSKYKLFEGLKMIHG